MVTIQLSLAVQQLQQSDRINPYSLNLGNRLPAHATSAGKVLLAYLDSDIQKEWLNKYPLKMLTKYTPTDNSVFIQLLQKIRNDDYCYSSEEHELGVHALAVPIYNSKSHVVATLNIVAPTSRVSKDYLLQHIHLLLQQTAQELHHFI